MKRKFTAWLLVLTAVVLTGCNAAQVSNMMELQDTTIPVMQTGAVPEIHYQVELELYEDAAYAEDGQLLASYRAQVPVMTACLQDGTPLENPKSEMGKHAVAVAEAFNQQFEIWVSEEGFWELTGVQEEMDFRRENGLLPMERYSMDLSCTVYQTEHLVSVAGLCYSDTGGAHPNTWELGWNFDLVSGSFMDGELASGDRADFQKAVAEELQRQAAAAAQENGHTPEEMYWPEYETLLQEWDSYTVYFDSTGMTVAFSPYELAPYVRGTQKFHLSYDWLRPLLDEHGCQILELEPLES